MSILAYGPRQRTTCSVLKESEGWQVPDHVCACVQTVLKHIIWRMDALQTTINIVVSAFAPFLGRFLVTFWILCFCVLLGRVSEARKKTDKGVRPDFSKSGGDPPPPIR